MKHLLLILFLIFSTTWSLQSQVIKDPVPVDNTTDNATQYDTTSSEKVIVDYSEFVEGFIEDGQETRYLKGKVELRQGDIFMYCDTAVIFENDVQAVGNVIIQQSDSLTIFADSLSYVGADRKADLFGDVVLLNKEQKLFTNRLNYNLNTKTAKYFTGATLTNGDTKLISKRGYYYVNSDLAHFKDSVVVVDPEFSLRTDTLQFETKNRKAIFLGPTLIHQNDAKIYCESGFYEIENKTAEFTGNAQYLSGNQQATADKITYDGATKKIDMVGNANYKDGDKNATADKIIYDESTGKTDLIGNAHYIGPDQEVKSNSILYDAETGSIKTEGRSNINNDPQFLVADNIDFNNQTKTGIANGNVVWTDTSSNISIASETIDYKNENHIVAYGDRPLLISMLEGDSFFMKSDTLISLTATYAVLPDTTMTDSLTIDSAATTTIPTNAIATDSVVARTLLAYQNVSIFKSDLQAVCDSLIYSEKDSVFWFYNDPIIWSDTSQFSADTIAMQMKDGKIDRIYLYNNSMIINSTDEQFYNQIKGKFITAFFEENELRRMKVEGNAESVYYALDDDKAYMGVNKTICSDMLLYFGNNEVETIKFYAEPKSTMFPMGQANHEELKLPGFNWSPKKRPLSIADL